jgi:hypothetical protein
VSVHGARMLGFSRSAAPVRLSPGVAPLPVVFVQPQDADPGELQPRRVPVRAVDLQPAGDTFVESVA